MDSDRLTEKQRATNRRKGSTGFDPFSYHLAHPLTKSDDLNSSLNFKKFPSAVDGDFKHWTIVSEGFPPGTTVDELKKYGRRKQLSHLKPQDNLRVEEGSVRPYVSEYTRRYHLHRPIDFKSDESIGDKENVPYKDLVYHVPQNKKHHSSRRLILKRPPNHLEPMQVSPMDYNTEKNSQFVFYPHFERRKLLRRSTALKPEGEMTSETEVRREYRAYPNPERAQLIRRLPSLKIEGDFESMITEQQDKFIAFLLNKRPIMEKKKTLLRMEGDFDFLTEKNQNYVPHEPPPRLQVRKRSTSLKLDGELEFFPEYRQSFVDFSRTRPITYKPNGTLRSDDGELEKRSETKTQFVNFNNVQVPESAKPENNLHIEGAMDIAPEYRVNYVDFPRERPFIKRPPNQFKPEGNLQVLTENTARYPEHQTLEKPESLKRPNNLKLEGTFDFVSEQNEKFKKHESPEKTELIRMAPSLKLEGDMNFVTEKADKFGFLVGDREKAEERPSSLKLEGEFLFQPEYQKSFSDFRTPSKTLKPVRTFRSNPPSPRKAPKDRIKFNLEEDKKFVLGTPSRRLSSRRLSENTRPPEKNLKFDLPHSNLPKFRDIGKRQEIEFNFPTKIKVNNPMKLDAYLGRQGVPLSPIQPKNFQAFDVLDVKGQLGCQSMRKDPLDYEKSTSEDENSTYRLEVSNPEKSGFPGREWKVFPPPTGDPEIREEAEKRARRRAETYEKIVKRPEIANHLLLEENNNNNNNITEKSLKSCGKLSPLYPTDEPSKVSFVVLDGSRETNLPSKESVKGDKTDWEMPGWLNPAPIS